MSQLCKSGCSKVRLDIAQLFKEPIGLNYCSDYINEGVNEKGLNSVQVYGKRWSEVVRLGKESEA